MKKRISLLLVTVFLLMISCNVNASVTKSNKDDLISIIDGRKFYKLNQGETLVGYAYNGIYTGPVLVGKTPNSVEYYSPDHSSCDNLRTTGTIKYLGRTYYYSNGDCWVKGDLEDESGLSLTKYNGKAYEVAQELIKDNVSIFSKILYYGGISLAGLLVCFIFYSIGRKSKKVDNYNNV